MKKMFLLVTALCLMMFSSVVSAEESEYHHDWSHPAYHHENWKQVDNRAEESMPFKWHEHRDYHAANYRMERIHGREWEERFPGLHPYSWHGEDFWHQGHHVRDAVLLYNDSDELVSVGFWHEGTFIFIRDDHRSYENHDPFFESFFKVIINVR